MSDVTDLTSRRNPSRAMRCPACGGAWFTLSVVALQENGEVSAWGGKPTCNKCGVEVVPDDYPDDA